MSSDLASPGARTRPEAVGLALAIAGAIAFSGKTIIVKLAYRFGVDAVTLIMLRMLFAMPLFIALAWWAGRGKPPLTAADWRAVIGLGFCGYYLASFLDFVGLQFVSASVGRLIQYLTPMLVLVGSALIWRRPITKAQWLAMAVGYAGVGVVFGREVSFEGAQVWLGAALVFGSAVSYSIYLIASGQVVRRLGSLRLTGLATLVACTLCILQYLVLRPWDTALHVAPQVIWLSVLNATLCTFAPVLMVMMAIERIGATAASQAGMVGPMSTIVLGALLLGERFDAWVVLGTALVLVGVWLLPRQRA